MSKLILQLALLSMLATSNGISASNYLFIKNDNVQDSQLQKFLKDAILLPDIDGSSLQGDDLTYADGLDVIENYIKSIDSKATVVLVNVKDEEKKLKNDSNLFVVNIIVGQEVKKAVTRLINVNLSLKQQVDKLIHSFSNTIIGSNLDIKIKHKNIINFLNVLVKKTTNKIKITLTNDSDEDNNLVIGENKIKITLSSNNENFSKTLIIKDVREDNGEVFTKILNDFKVKSFPTIDGSKNLRLLDLIEDEILKYIPLANFKIVESEKASNTTTKVKVKITLANKQITKNFKIINLRNNFLAPELTPDQQKLNKIKEKLRGLFFSSNGQLTTRNVIEDTLPIILKALASYKDITFSISDTMYSKQNLVEKDNAIVLKMVLNDAIDTVDVTISEVVELDDDRLERVKNNIGPFDGSKLTTASNKADLLKLIAKNIRKIDKKIKVELEESEDEFKLIEGTNSIKVVLKIGEKSEIIEISLTDVKKSDIDKLNEIVDKFFVESLDGKELVANTEFKNSLGLIQEYIDKFNYGVKAKIINENQMLIERNNEVEVELTLGKEKLKTRVRIINIQKSKKDKLNDILTKLQPFDGSKFTTDQKFDDTLEFVSAEMSKFLQANGLNFKDIKINSTSGEQKLVSGIDNYFNINLIVDGQEISTRISIVNIKLSDQDRIDAIAEQMKAKEIDGSHLTTSDTIGDALKIINDEFKNLDDAVTIELDDANSATEKLVIGDNEISIKISSGDKSRIEKIKVVNVKMSDADRVNKFKIKINNYNFDDHEFTTDHKKTFALEEVLNKICDEDERNGLTWEWANPEDADGNLKFGNNEFKFKFTKNGITEDVTININNVVLSKNDLFNKIKTEISNLEIDGSEFESGQVLNDALEKIKVEVGKIAENVSIKIVDDHILTDGENRVRIMVKYDDFESVILPVKIVNVKLSDRDRVIKFIDKIKNEKIDGSDLTTDVKIQEMLENIRKLYKEIDPKITISLVDEDIKSDDLNSNDNHIKLNISSGDYTEEIIVTVTDVKLSDSDRINNVIKTLEKTTIDGSTLTTENTNEDLLKLILPLIKEIDPNVEVSIADEDDLELALEEGTNKIIVNIKSGNLIKRQEFSITNVQKSEKDFLEEISNKLINLEIDGSNFTTDNTYGDFLNYLKDWIKNSDEYRNIKIDLIDGENWKAKLKENENTIDFDISILKNNKAVKIKLINVKLSDSDIVNKIATKFNDKEYDLGSLETDNTYYDALNEIKSEIIKQFPNAKVVLIDDSDQKLKENENDIKINIEINGIKKDIIIKGINVKLCNNDRIDNLINKINEKQNIDGSTLTTNHNLTDGLNLIREYISELDTEAIINLENSKFAIKKLNENDNSLSITIILNGLTRTISVNVNNVKLCDYDVMNNIIKKLSNDQIDGSQLTTNNTHNDALELVKAKIKELYAEDFTVEFENNDISDEKLLEDVNDIVINVKIKEEERLIKLKVVNVKISTEARIQNIIKYLKEKNQIINNKFQSDQQMDELLKELQEQVKKIDPDATLKISEELLSHNLRDIKVINIGVKINDKEEDFNYSISSVKLSNKDLFEEIEKISKDFNVSNLTTDNVQQDILVAFRTALESLIKSGYSIDSELFDSENSANKSLKFEKDKVIVKIILKDGTDKVITLELNNIKKASDLEKLEKIVSFLEKSKSIKIPITCIEDKKYVIKAIVNELIKTDIIKDMDEVSIVDIDNNKKSANLIAGRTYTIKVKVKIGKYEKEMAIKFTVTLLSDEVCLID